MADRKLSYYTIEHKTKKGEVDLKGVVATLIPPSDAMKDKFGPTATPFIITYPQKESKSYLERSKMFLISDSPDDAVDWVVGINTASNYNPTFDSNKPLFSSFFRRRRGSQRAESKVSSEAGVPAGGNISKEAVENNEQAIYGSFVDLLNDLSVVDILAITLPPVSFILCRRDAQIVLMFVLYYIAIYHYVKAKIVLSELMRKKK